MGIVTGAYQTHGTPPTDLNFMGTIVTNSDGNGTQKLAYSASYTADAAQNQWNFSYRY